jgi:phosphohistidine phosphatase
LIRIKALDQFREHGHNTYQHCFACPLTSLPPPIAFGEDDDEHEQEQERGEAYFGFALKTMELVASRGYFHYRERGEFQTMQLYLLRHAEAEDDPINDERRALTAKGEKQARSVGRFCRDHSIIPGLVLSSPLRRAAETARIFARELNLEDAVLLEEFLRPGLTLGRMFSGLEKCPEKASILLVGHEPDLSELAGSLIGTRAENIHFRKATLMSVKLLKMESGAGAIDFLIPVKCL